ncbi:hypothetical protein [Evansella tamaricis]|uniref:Uncharacterized protein n=1 Tax=Evansella tamaricis TaxID=2069301 RepID=A0ABS6JFJ2_9BACI|nr:hypothetical protein [Evansella tamaricis]MBU9711098.1 hypothetical protein [Evansella tamaricis]
MKGAFQISREIFENPIWNDPVKFRIFFYIIGNAVFSQEGIEHAGMHLKRGQFLRSLRNLQDDLSYKEGRGNALKKYPLTTIQRKLKSLEKEEKITMKCTEYGTLFTVVNYALYQSFDHYKNPSVEQIRNSDGTVMEQRWNNNKNVKECSVVVEEKGDPIDLIANRFTDLKTMQSGRPSYPNQKDYQAIAQIVARGVPTSQTIELLDRCFDDFNKRNPGESITSFNYCVKFIDKQLKLLKAKEEAKKGGTNVQDNRGSHDQTPREDSITGGQLGWIGKRRA